MNSHYHLLAKCQTYFTVLGIVIRLYNLWTNGLHYVDFCTYQRENILYIIGKCSPFQALHDIGRLRLKCDGTRAETSFCLSAKRTIPFKSAGASVQSTTGSRVVCASAVVMLDIPCSEVV